MINLNKHPANPLLGNNVEPSVQTVQLMVIDGETHQKIQENLVTIGWDGKDYSKDRHLKN